MISQRVLPPGVSRIPGDEEWPCDVCGKLPDDCICPECPVCGAYGDKACYGTPSDPAHGLWVCLEQMDSRAKYERTLEAEAAREAAWAEEEAREQRWPHWWSRTGCQLRLVEYHGAYVWPPGACLTVPLKEEWLDAYAFGE